MSIYNEYPSQCFDRALIMGWELKIMSSGLHENLAFNNTVSWLKVQSYVGPKLHPTWVSTNFSLIASLYVTLPGAAKWVSELTDSFLEYNLQQERPVCYLISTCTCLIIDCPNI